MAGEPNQTTAPVEDDPTPDDLEIEDQPGDAPNEPEQKPAAAQPADPYAGLSDKDRRMLEMVNKAGVSPEELMSYAAKGYDTFQQEMKAKEAKAPAAGGDEDIIPVTKREFYDLARKLGENVPKMVGAQQKEFQLQGLLDANPEIADDPDARSYVDAHARAMVKTGVPVRDAYRAAHKKYLDWEAKVKQKHLQKKIAAQKTRGESSRGSSVTDLPKMDFEHKESDLVDGTASRQATEMARKMEAAMTGGNRR